MTTTTNASVDRSTPRSTTSSSASSRATASSSPTTPGDRISTPSRASASCRSATGATTSSRRQRRRPGRSPSPTRCASRTSPRNGSRGSSPRSRRPGLDWAFFCSGGSEALDSTVKLVRQYWLDRGQPSRWKVIGRRPSFHGNTLNALSVGYHAGRRAAFEPYLLDLPHLQAPWIYRCERHGMDGPWCDECSGRALADVIEAAGPETVAAFIAEPIVGAAAPGVTAAARLLRDDPRDLRSLRGPVHRRRGDHRHRPDGPRLRDPALGRCART